MSHSFTRRLLFPLIPLYRLALAFHELSLLLGMTRRLRYPVVSIGNLSTGGAGKTPLVIALARALERRGIRVDVLSRGYGRQTQWIARVEEDGSAEEFGDEPLLIARATGVPVYVAAERYDAGLQAEADIEAEEEAKAAAEAEAEAERAAEEAEDKAKAEAEAVAERLALEAKNEAEAEQTGQESTEVEPDSAAELAAPVPAAAPEPDSDTVILDMDELRASVAQEDASDDFEDSEEEEPDEPPPAQQPPAQQSPAEPPSATTEKSVPAEKAEKKVNPKSLRVHLLDDGFQHRQLARDVNILMLSQQDWQDWLLPAGNLREPLEAIRRASVIAISVNEPELEVALQLSGWTGPIWRLHRTMEIPAVHGPVVAFSGIARPQQFFEGLEDAGVELAGQVAFPDHFTYTAGVLNELIAEAIQKDAVAMITTEKDLVRMGPLANIFPRSMPLHTAILRLKIEEQQAAIDWLLSRLLPALPR
jgi:tetraacyldisaccharide-1-P 4'-kinase